MKYIDVIVPLPLEGLFTYSVPEHLESKVAFGVRVHVPFGRSKTYLAVVVSVHENKPQDFDARQIASVVDEGPVILPQQYQLWQWISYYYMSPIGEVFNAALPLGMKADDRYKPRTETYIRLAAGYRSEEKLHEALDQHKRALKQHAALMAYLDISDYGDKGEKMVTKEEFMNESRASASVVSALVSRGILETYEVEVGRLNHGGEPDFSLIKRLNDAQTRAYNELQFSFLKKNITLLHGVTSSGKTEIYIHLIRQAIEQKKQVLYLLPEIALTVQIMDRLRKVFGNKLGIYHSKYSDAERVEIWQKQLSDNPYEVILGARSAVFLPFQRLGLVIVDEEHETSFKQQDPMPRYHARSAAIMLAQMYGAKTLLGTATPSVESYHNAKTGKYGLVELKQRYQGVQLPEICIVDTKDLQHRKMMNGPFSPLLLNRVREALANGEQAILFQNRRGFAPMIECKKCGWVPKCQNCDVSLTLHRNMNQLTCHYCGYVYRVPEACPSCEDHDLRTRGYGTEKIEDAIVDIFPEVKVARMDLDTTRTRNAYERIINDFAEGRTNILIGTQMVSKGLDFENVSVVGILNADSMMNYPDFRAYEHAFMMMSQVSGRAGRRGKRGLVILQTKSPQSPLIDYVVRNDYEALYSNLVAERQMFHYPPYTHLIYVYLKHKSDDVVNTASIELAGRLRQWFGARVLGPDKPSVAKVKTLNIRKIVLKLENGIDNKKVRQYLMLAQQQILADKRYAALQVYYDVDPM